MPTSYVPAACVNHSTGSPQLLAGSSEAGIRILLQKLLSWIVLVAWHQEIASSAGPLGDVVDGLRRRKGVPQEGLSTEHYLWACTSRQIGSNHCSQGANVIFPFSFHFISDKDTLKFIHSLRMHSSRFLY